MYAYMYMFTGSTQNITQIILCIKTTYMYMYMQDSYSNSCIVVGGK